MDVTNDGCYVLRIQDHICNDKHMFSSYLVSIIESCNGDWVFLGDFNDILNGEEKRAENLCKFIKVSSKIKGLDRYLVLVMKR